MKISWKDGLIKSLIILFLLFDLVLVFYIVKQCSKPKGVPEKSVVSEESKILQIEVLNGCGVPGIANQFTDYLRMKGFDVVKTANYEEELNVPNFNVLTTVVIDRRGRLENGIRIAEALGLGRERVLQEVNEAYLIDASVILGKDYAQLESWQRMEK